MFGERPTQSWEFGKKKNSVMQTRQRSKRSFEEVMLDDVRDLTSRFADDVCAQVKAVKSRCNREMQCMREEFEQRIRTLNGIVDVHAAHLRNINAINLDYGTTLEQITRRLGCGTPVHEDWAPSSADSSISEGEMEQLTGGLPGSS